MTEAFDPTAYGPAVAHLLTPSRLAELGPGVPNASAREALMRFDPLTDLGRPLRDPALARACLSGLWLYHDYLDESHQISQDLPSAEGSFWHAILHRREPDAANSRYWWRKVGAHPVLTRLAEQAATEGLTFFGPLRFVELCEQVRGTGSAAEQEARLVQRLEWVLLFDWCHGLATGSASPP